MLFLALSACCKWVVGVSFPPKCSVRVVVSGVSDFVFVVLCYSFPVSVTKINIVLLMFE